MYKGISTLGEGQALDIGSPYTYHIMHKGISALGEGQAIDEYNIYCENNHWH